MSKKNKSEILAGVEYASAKKLANNTWEYIRPDGARVIRLHLTDILTFLPDGSVRLNSGGWRTSTTKGRMNAYLPPGWSIWQHRGIWTLTRNGNPSVLYADGMVINPDDTVTGAAPEGDDKAKAREVKAIAEYARKFAKAFLAGEVPKPSGGDCWGCHLREEKTGANAFGLDHYREHIKSGYFVPSLLCNACAAIPVCMFTTRTIGRLWHGNAKASEISEYEKEIATRDIVRSITRFLKREFGIAA